MSEFSAEFDKRELAAFQRKLQRVSRETPRIVARALNRGLTSARAAASKIVAKEQGLKSASVKKRLWPTKASKQKLTAVLTASQRRMKVQGRQTKKGVVSGRGANKKLHERSWLWKNKVPLQRRGATRYPIRLITGPSVAEAWTPHMRAIEKKALTMIKKTLDHELNRLGRK